MEPAVDHDNGEPRLAGHSPNGNGGSAARSGCDPGDKSRRSRRPERRTAAAASASEPGRCRGRRSLKPFLIRAGTFWAHGDENPTPAHVPGGIDLTAAAPVEITRRGQ